MDDNVIYETADVTPMFSVTVDENEAAQRCKLKGKYLLVVNLHNLALVDCGTKKAIFQWPFKYIRRFGKTRSNFQFEAGRKCPSGEGEFTFLTEHGFQIFDAFTKTTQKIKSIDDEPVAPAVHGHVRAKSDGENGSKTNVLRSSGTQSASGVSVVSEGHSRNGRKSVKSGGSVGHVDDFKSELTSVVLKQNEEHYPGTEESKDKVKTKKDRARERELKNQEKAREKEREKARKKEEEMREKEMKEMKEREKKVKKKKLKASTSQPYQPIHAYEDVDDMAAGSPEPEPLYAEADPVTTPAPKAKPRTKQQPELYSEPQKIKKDAWKEHGREVQENEHEEDYDTIKQAASMKDADINLWKTSDENPDETYDHIGNICRSASVDTQESIYGSASGKSIASIKKEKAEMYDYEEALPKSNPKKTAHVDQYEEPALMSPSIKLSADWEDDDGYADVSTT